MKHKKNTGQSFECRVIAGSLRGRKIQFAQIPACRPTPDRVRETLFNWLTPTIQGATCIDLFAGSGVLSIEALSRGAHHAIAIDQAPEVAHKIMEQAQHLKIAPEQLSIRQQTYHLFSGMGMPTTTADIVFCDPPYQGHFLEQCATWLQQQLWVNNQTLVYFESDRYQALDQIEQKGWAAHKRSKAGQVHYGLFHNPNVA